MILLLSCNRLEPLMASLVCCGKYVSAFQSVIIF